MMIPKTTTGIERIINEGFSKVLEARTPRRAQEGPGPEARARARMQGDAGRGRPRDGDPDRGEKGRAVGAISASRAVPSLDATRVHLTMTWVVFFFEFEPVRTASMLRAGCSQEGDGAVCPGERGGS